MKAFYITEPGSSGLRDLSEPFPQPGEVLLKTRIIGLCGTDLSTFRGKNPLVSYPRIPGHEIAATIMAVGDNVPEEWQPGLDVTAYPNTSCRRCASCLQRSSTTSESRTSPGAEATAASTSMRGTVARTTPT